MHDIFSIYSDKGVNIFLVWFLNTMKKAREYLYSQLKVNNILAVIIGNSIMPIQCNLILPATIAFNLFY